MMLEEDYFLGQYPTIEPKQMPLHPHFAQDFESQSCVDLIQRLILDFVALLALLDQQVEETLSGYKERSTLVSK